MPNFRLPQENAPESGDSEDNQEIQCEHCHNILLLKRHSVECVIYVIIEKDSRQIKLTTFPECLSDFFQLSGKSDLKSLSMAFLELENVEISHNKKRIITKIEHHPEDPVL